MVIDLVFAKRIVLELGAVAAVACSTYGGIYFYVDGKAIAKLREPIDIHLLVDYGE